MSSLIGPTTGRPVPSIRVPINIHPVTRASLVALPYMPGMRGVGYSEFINRAVEAALDELEAAEPECPRWTENPRESDGGWA